MLSFVGSIGLAASAGTALIVDVGGRGLASESRTLRDIADSGPTLAELRPGRTGVAVVSGVGLEEDLLRSTLAELAGSWQAIVLMDSPSGPGQRVPLTPLLPGLAAIDLMGPGVWQPAAGFKAAPGPGLVLPRLRSGLVRQLLRRQLPHRSRWIRAWSPVWEMPWA